MKRRQFLATSAAAAATPMLLGTSGVDASELPAIEFDQNDVTIRGYTAPGYQRVREVFAEQAYLMGDGGVAFAATRGGELVVDLWAGWASAGQPWNRNTKVHIQSTSKGVTAMTAMVLADRGELDLDAPVSRYWPEYGVNGKENTTVRMLLSHAAGSTRLPGYTELLDLDGNGFDQYDEIARRLAAAEPDWEPGTGHGYHGYTYGNLVSELVYRITGQRAGEFLRDELAAPWYLNTWLGTPTEEQRDLAVIKPWPAAPAPPEIAALFEQVMAAQEENQNPLTQPGNWVFDAGFRGLLGGPMDTFMLSIRQLWSQPRALEAEFGAANVTTDARSLARLWTPLAMQGELDGRRFVSAETVRDFITPTPPGGPDKVLGIEMNWTPGSQKSNSSFLPGVPAPFGPNPNAFGMSGGGGNHGCADADAGIACGFVRNHYSNDGVLSALLIDAVHSAAKGVS